MSEENLKERARRVLMDNAGDAAGGYVQGRHGPMPMAEGVPSWTPAAPDPDPEPDPDLELLPLPLGDEVELRLQAIRLVRDLGPKRSCFAERVRDLSLSLVETSGDSIHYRAALEKLHEAHEEWLRLEEKLWAATYIIRSTQWLVDLLADPSERTGEATGPRK